MLGPGKQRGLHVLFAIRIQRHQSTFEGVQPADPFKAGKVDRMLQDLEDAFRHLAQAFISSLWAKAFMQRARTGSTVVG